MGEGEINFDTLFSIFCITMRQPEEVFFKSTLRKVLFLIDKYIEQHMPRQKQARVTSPSQVNNVKSMKQMKRMIGGI